MFSNKRDIPGDSNWNIPVVSFINSNSFHLKISLNVKPWEANVIDTVSVWKFNGNDYTSLMLIADYLGLKKTVDLNTLPEVSKKYWETVEVNPTEALEYISLQSATQTNLVIQLLNELRQL